MNLRACLEATRQGPLPYHQYCYQTRPPRLIEIADLATRIVNNRLMSGAEVTMYRGAGEQTSILRRLEKNRLIFRAPSMRRSHHFHGPLRKGFARLSQN